MNRYILDTDHLTLLKRNHPVVRAKISSIPPADIFVTIVTIEEQLRGRLAVISKIANQPERFSMAYDYLFDSFQDFYNLNLLRLDRVAADYFQQFRKQKIRIGSQDLKIASIALSQKATLLTRNYKDFIQVPGLSIEDWSV
ncbi:type II toxin-antitoxin system VapC family toxin [Chamaesiphon minutus]|uniref:Putative nucleic acid-binding protein, contains PIN domain n=1 Tax=Chamaesiphon minutus (strain ATCC 27169 / PCC 6605) TaxID=1173020 RepID=K9UBA4_CHAP6|nr:type II toxin-antitoxin system VapC family toxin [Chamaesiphon minutus]AFY91504.1 putative nucleic acid-binding protein, contains PIN domain [Chamaesiphon minutus PCC 6605]